jgi:O-antigen ligase
MRAVAKTPYSSFLFIGLILGAEIVLAVLLNIHYKLAFLIGGGILVVAIALIKMEWMAPILVISLFVMGVSLGAITESTGGNLRIFHLVAAFLIVRWFYYAMVTQQRYLVFPTSIVTPTLFILAWATLSIVWSPDLRFAVYRFVKLGLSIGGALVFINISKHKSVENRVIWYWVFSGVAGGILAYFSWYEGDQQTGETWVSHQNIVSELMNVVTFLSLGMAILTRRKWFRWISIFTVVFALAVNANTGCRGGFMGFIVGAAVLFILGVFNSKAGRRFPVILSTFFLICFSILGYLISTMESLVLYASGRSFDLMDPMATDTFAWRMETIRTAWGIMQDYSAYVWGMGIGAWEYLQDIYMQYTWARFIHNFYFNFFFQYGAIGIVLMLWLFVRILSPIIRAYKWFSDYQTRWFLNCLIALYVCLAVHGLVSIEEVNSYIWILFATTSVFIDHLRSRHELGLPANSMI